MDLNWILIWLTGVSSAINLVMSLQQRQSPAWGWRAVLTAILMLLAVLWITVPHIAGYIVAPIWFFFALLPGLLLRRVNQLLANRKHRRAYWLARIAGLLHPSDGWPQHAQLVRALTLFEQGEPDEASTILSKLRSVSTSLGRTVRLIQAQQTGDWQGLLSWIDARFTENAVQQDESLLIARLQALGELGRTDEMLAQMQRILGDSHGPSALSKAVLQMRVAALSGQVATTERQLTALSRAYPTDVRTYWRLTAEQVAGEEGVTDRFRHLQESASPFLQPMIARRIEQPLTRFDMTTASEPATATLLALGDRVNDDAQNAIWANDERRRPWATWGIALVLVLTFIREMMGSPATPAFSFEYLMSLFRHSLDLNNLIDMGALIVPQSYTPGEWWRVLTAGFLHFGPLHLGLNLLGLLALAPRLERAWGPLPMIVCYLTATFTSMSLAPHVMRLDDDTPFQVLVGASGGMMGLLGGLVGFLFVSWLRKRSDQTRKPLMFLLLIIALQTSFDLMTPNVSFACHSLGLITGTMFGIAWTWSSQRRTARRSVAP